MGNSAQVRVLLNATSKTLGWRDAGLFMAFFEEFSFAFARFSFAVFVCLDNEQKREALMSDRLKQIL